MAETKKETAKTENMVDVYEVKHDTTIVMTINGKPSECFFGRGSVVKVKAGAVMDKNTFKKLRTEDAPEQKKDKFFDPTI